MIGRMCCALILHVQTEKFIRHGLNMMKYAINHPKEFSSPTLAVLLGLKSVVITMALTFAIIIHISA